MRRVFAVLGLLLSISAPMAPAARAQGAAPAGAAPAGTAPTGGSGSPTLDAVRARGKLLCGTAGTVAGFSLADSQGVMHGIDADGCRAMAAAIFGDPEKVQYVRTTTQSRFTALQSGEVDVLYRQVTWTLGREASLGLLFGVPYFYDGTGFLVKTSAGVKSAKELNGATICVQPGTSTELAIADYFRENNLKFSPVEINDIQQLEAAFMSGRCDAFSTDSSALAGFRSTQGDKANELTLLPDVISKEPLGPMVRKGDDKWYDLLRWISYAQLTAEENDLTSKNVDQALTSTKPDVRRLLGLDGDLGKQLGVDNKWAYNVIKMVGNTGEVWDRDIAPMGVPRGLNNLWNRGGIQYAPPLR